MGSGSSVSREERKQKEVQRFAMIHQVEKFVINAYACCPRVERMRLMLSSEMARKAFSSFVKSEHAEEILALYIMASDLSKPKERVNIYIISKEFMKLVVTYIQASDSATATQVFS